MSSEMRVTDAMVEAALDGLDNACMDIAKRELQPHDVLWRGFSRIRRMEAMRAALNAALLARTEAGAPHHPLAICPTCKDYYEVCECTPDAAPVADGAVAWLVRCRRTGRVVWSDPSRSTAEGYARQIAHRMPDNTLDTEVIPLHTHPQDASGNAVSSAASLLRQMLDGYDNPPSLLLMQAARIWLKEHAMQAKEAKS